MLAHAPPFYIYKAHAEEKKTYNVFASLRPYVLRFTFDEVFAEEEL